ncbi:MAG: hypothetical protein V1824_03155 [archaeon]
MLFFRKSEALREKVCDKYFSNILNLIKNPPKEEPGIIQIHKLHEKGISSEGFRTKVSIQLEKEINKIINIYLKEYEKLYFSRFKINEKNYGRERKSDNMRYYISTEEEEVKRILSNKLETMLLSMQKRLNKKYSYISRKVSVEEKEAFNSLKRLFSEANISVDWDSLDFLSKKLYSNPFFAYSFYAKELTPLNCNRIGIFIRLYNRLIEKDYSVEEYNKIYQEENGLRGTNLSAKTKSPLIISRLLGSNPKILIHEIFHEIFLKNKYGSYIATVNGQQFRAGTEFFVYVITDLISYIHSPETLREDIEGHKLIEKNKSISEIHNILIKAPEVRSYLEKPATPSILQGIINIEKYMKETDEGSIGGFARDASIKLYEKYNGNKEKIEQKILSDLKVLFES